MKYGIFVDSNNLTGVNLGTLIVCTNPLTVLKEDKYNAFQLYKVEEALPLGTYRCIIQDKRITLNKDKQYTCEIINPQNHFIVFEPDSNFDKLGSGFVKEVSFFKLKAENLKDSCFFLCSDKEGPKNWNVGVINDNKLHISNGVLDITKLLDSESKK